MSYIDRNLLSGEQILFRTKKHLIIFLIPAIWTMISVFLSAGFDSFFAPAASLGVVPDMIFKMLPWIPWAFALLLWAGQALQYVTSEFVVTNKRVMMREGFFFRHTNELRLTTISQVSVTQSLVGQLLNYGTVAINAFGAFDAYSLIADPFQFQRKVNDQLDKLIS